MQKLIIICKIFIFFLLVYTKSREISRKESLPNFPVYNPRLNIAPPHTTALDLAGYNTGRYNPLDLRLSRGLYDPLLLENSYL